MEYVLKKLEDWATVAADVIRKIGAEKKTVLALKGDLGAGKTTFVKVLMEALGSDELVNSPTFSIVNEYGSDRGTIYHMDLYRLDTFEELLDIGFEEYIISGDLCIIEWPNIASPIIEDICILMEITITDEHYRSVKIS
jgi:tRNA threonylcarbamoyladenosine biosynthesis protein TsaE